MNTTYTAEELNEMLNEALAENEKLSAENRRLKARVYAGAGGNRTADGYPVLLRLPDDAV